MKALLDEEVEFFDAFSSRIERYSVRVGWKAITPDDRFELTPDELAMFSKANDKVQAASGAARHLARRILRDRGLPEVSIMKTPSGKPIWPDNLMGSISHSNEIAIAVVCNRTDFLGIGVDVEEKNGVTADLVPLILTPNEQAKYGNEFAASIFTIKEACYKACYEADSIFFSFLDIEVSLETSRARTHYGREVDFVWSEGSHSAAFALIAK